MEIIKEKLMYDMLVIMFYCFVSGFILCLLIWLNWQSKSIEKTLKSETLYCFECEIETPVKVKNGGMYCSNCGYIIKMVAYSITVICPHDIAEIKVLECTATCEKTVLVCTECGQELEPTKTEC